MGSGSSNSSFAKNNDSPANFSRETRGYYLTDRVTHELRNLEPQDNNRDLILDTVYTKAGWYYENSGAFKHSYLVLFPREQTRDVLVLEKNSIGVHLYLQKPCDTILFAVRHNGERVNRRNVNLFMDFENFETTLRELIEFINYQDLLSYDVLVANCNDFVRDVSIMLLKG